MKLVILIFLFTKVQSEQGTISNIRPGVAHTFNEFIINEHAKKSNQISDAMNVVKSICSTVVGGVPDLCGEATIFYYYKCCTDPIRCCWALTDLSIIILFLAGGVVALIVLCCVCCCCCCRRKADRRPQIIQILPPSNPSDNSPPYSRLSE